MHTRAETMSHWLLRCCCRLARFELFGEFSFFSSVRNTARDASELTINTDAELVCLPDHPVAQGEIAELHARVDRAARRFS